MKTNCFLLHLFYLEGNSWLFLEASVQTEVLEAQTCVYKLYVSFKKLEEVLYNVKIPFHKRYSIPKALFLIDSTFPLYWHL